MSFYQTSRCRLVCVVLCGVGDGEEKGSFKVAVDLFFFMYFFDYK